MLISFVAQRLGGGIIKGMKKYFIVSLLVLVVFLSSGLANAASTIGNNMSTTGTFTQTVGSATAALFQNAAGTITVLAIDTTNTRVGIGGTPGTTFEVQGTASASYFFTQNTIQVGGTTSSVAYSRFGISTTGHSNYISTTNDLLISGDLEVRATASFGSVASVSGVFYLANGQVRPGIGGDSTTAFRFQNAAGSTTVLTIDTTNTRVGIGKTPATALDISGSASVSVNFEAVGYASATRAFITTSLVVGSNVASNSTYIAEFGKPAVGSGSFLFAAGGNSASTQGTCFQLKDTVGKWIYMRFPTGTTTPLLSAIRCQ